jgi:type I restriction enzyme R subunit
MYLDKPLRDHNLLQAIARTNRPLPSMQKRTGLVMDYFGVFANLEKALNFDESIREESLIDWDALRATVPGEVAHCMAPFEGITIADTRECLLTALRRLREADAAKTFEQNFKSLERLWEAIAPDPCLYPHRHQYNWLCGIYVAHRRRQRGSKDTYGELSAKTRQLIQENTTFINIAEALPVFRIDKDYVTKLDELPTPADKAAALEAILTGELSEDDPGFTYRQLGERLQRVKERKDAGDDATARRLRELEEIAAAAAATKEEPDRLNLTQPGEYGCSRSCGPMLHRPTRATLPTAHGAWSGICEPTNCFRRGGVTRSAGACASSNRCWPSPGTRTTLLSASIRTPRTHRS